MSMKNILLPTDFSENSWNAIEYTLNLFQKNICNFYLLHVNRLNTLVEGDTTYVPTQEVVERQYTKPAKKKLRQIFLLILKRDLNLVSIVMEVTMRLKLLNSKLQQK